MITASDLDPITTRALHDHIGNGSHMPAGTRTPTEKPKDKNQAVKKEMWRMKKDYARQADAGELLSALQIKILYPKEATAILQVARGGEIQRVKSRGAWRYNRQEIENFLKWKKHFTKQQKLF